MKKRAVKKRSGEVWELSNSLFLKVLNEDLKKEWLTKITKENFVAVEFKTATGLKALSCWRRGGEVLFYFWIQDYMDPEAEKEGARWVSIMPKRKNTKFDIRFGLPDKLALRQGGQILGRDPSY